MMGKYSLFVIFRALDEMTKSLTRAVVITVALIIVVLSLWLGLSYS